MKRNRVYQVLPSSDAHPGLQMEQSSTDMSTSYRLSIFSAHGVKSKERRVIRETGHLIAAKSAKPYVTFTLSFGLVRLVCGNFGFNFRTRDDFSSFLTFFPLSTQPLQALEYKYKVNGSSLYKCT
jgi:hypothetical protein